jgi:hypothetical protein
VDVPVDVPPDIAPDAGPILVAFDFTTLPPGPAATLPGGLILRRASAATVQTGSSTVITAGIGPDVARIGRASDADPYALVFEEARTNLVPDSRNLGASSWMASSMTTLTLDAAVGPDGVASADRVVVGAGGRRVKQQDALMPTRFRYPHNSHYKKVDRPSHAQRTFISRRTTLSVSHSRSVDRRREERRHTTTMQRLHRSAVNVFVR